MAKIITTSVSNVVGIALESALESSGLSLYGYVKALIVDDLLEGGHLQEAGLSRNEKNLLDMLEKFREPLAH